MHRKFITIIWTLITVIIIGIIGPVYFLEGDAVIFQVFITTIFMGIALVLLQMKNIDLENININISDTLDESVSEIKANLFYQERLNSILYEVTTKLNSPQLEDNELLTFILDKAIEAIPDSSNGSVLLHNPDGTFNYAALKGYDINKLRSIRLKKEDTYLYKATQGEFDFPVIIKDVSTFNNEYMEQDTYFSLRDAVPFDVMTVISAPIFIDNTIYGILNIDSMKTDAFNENDLNLTRFLTTHISFIIKNRQLLQKAYDLSMYDKLTGIYNRTYFEEIFNEFQSRAFTQSKKFALVLIDLNYLKKINDTFGHVIGDLALRTFTDEVRKHLSVTDVFARFGGDEFIVLLDNGTAEQARTKFESIVMHFENVYIDHNGLQIPIQFSYGITEAPAESMILDILVKFADERMYSNKKYLKIRNEDDPRFSTLK